MTQPRFAPITEDAQVRPIVRLDPPASWRTHRPAELQLGRTRAPVRAAGSGVPGPDQGYALRLAEMLGHRLVLVPGEDEEDVLAGAVAVALRRASLFGRAPVSTDIELALVLFGFLGEAPEELVARRRGLFGGAAHDYWAQRRIAHLVPESTLRMSVPGLAAKLGSPSGDWSELAGA